ncbi:MAG: hypothetical protein K5765_06965 [Clostridia bacterium]|nr:hypothetical protein [Clostridia bacterium]
MKIRTIEDIHDKEIGHKRFAWFVDTAIENGYKITDIKEYNEKFKFKMNGWPLEFDKWPDLSAKWQYELCCSLVVMNEKLKEIQGN